MQSKIEAGSAFPDLRVPRVGGGEVAPASMAGWRLFVVYRGKHCPLCKPYLSQLDTLMAEYAEAGVQVMAASADPAEKAEADLAEFGWRFPLGHSLTPAQMRELGLYISDPRSPQETDRPFAEPGLFLINPEGQVQVVAISNAPWARPDLAAVLRGAKRIQELGYPIRGTHPG